MGQYCQKCSLNKERDKEMLIDRGLDNGTMVHCFTCMQTYAHHHMSAGKQLSRLDRRLKPESTIALTAESDAVLPVMHKEQHISIY